MNLTALSTLQKMIKFPSWKSFLIFVTLVSVFAAVCDGIILDIFNRYRPNYQNNFRVVLDFVFCFFVYFAPPYLAFFYKVNFLKYIYIFIYAVLSFCFATNLVYLKTYGIYYSDWSVTEIFLLIILIPTIFFGLILIAYKLIIKMHLVFNSSK